MAVADQHHEHLGLVSKTEQRAGGVLIDHARLVDDEQVAST